MNVNFFPFSNSLQILGRRQSLANIMCNQQSVTQSRKKDLFVRNTMYDTGIYTLTETNQRFLTAAKSAVELPSDAAWQVLNMLAASAE